MRRTGGDGGGKRTRMRRRDGRSWVFEGGGMIGGCGRVGSLEEWRWGQNWGSWRGGWGIRIGSWRRTG